MDARQGTLGFDSELLFMLRSRKFIRIFLNAAIFQGIDTPVTSAAGIPHFLLY